MCLDVLSPASSVVRPGTAVAPSATVSAAVNAAPPAGVEDAAASAVLSGDDGVDCSAKCILAIAAAGGRESADRAAELLLGLSGGVASDEDMPAVSWLACMLLGCSVCLDGLLLVDALAVSSAAASIGAVGVGSCAPGESGSAVLW